MTAQVLLFEKDLYLNAVEYSYGFGTGRERVDIKPNFDATYQIILGNNRFYYLQSIF